MVAWQWVTTPPGHSHIRLSNPWIRAVQCSRDETVPAMSTIHVCVTLRKPRSILVAAALLSLALPGCGLTVSTFSINDAAYKAMWATDWGAINADARAFAPSSGSPGSCNTGGTKIGCYDQCQGG